MDVHKETLKPCNRNEERIHAKKEESVSIVEGRERRGTQVHIRTVEERVYQTLKVASNSTSVSIGKKNGNKRIV